MCSRSADKTNCIAFFIEKRKPVKKDKPKRPRREDEQREDRRK
jgi:hypothetical protein